MPRDPLEALQRLRRLETEAAKRRLGVAAGRLHDAEQRQDRADRALVAERADHPADFAAWLPRGLAERDRASLARRQAETALGQARTALAGHRTAERVVEQLQQLRAEEERRALLRRQQAALDEAAARVKDPV